MLKKQELDGWFDDLMHIIFDIKISIDNIQRMSSPANEYEEKILTHGFFAHLRRQYFFTLIIQLSKIFSDNKSQKRNLNKLFNRLVNDKYDDEINAQLEKNSGIERLFSSRKDITEEVKFIREELKVHQEAIMKIIVLRDTRFAHKDVDTAFPRISTKELETLVDLSIDIYNRIKGKLFDVRFLFEINTDWKVDPAISVWAEHRKNQIEEIERKKRELREARE